MKTRLRCAFVWAAMVWAIPLGAQTTLQRFERQLDQIQLQTATLVNPQVPLEQRALFDYGGYFTFNYLSLDDQNANNHGLKQYDLVGYVRLNFDGAQEFFGRGRLSWQNFNPGDSFDGEGNHFHGTVEWAMYRFDLARAMAAYSGRKIDYDLSLTAGRQLVYWANGLVLTRTVDGVLAGGSWQNLSLQGIAAVTAADQPDIDSSRPNFDDHTLRGFYGGMLTLDAGPHRPYVYGLVQRDYDTSAVLTTPAVPQPIVTHFGYNSYYVGAGSSGSLTDHLLYGVEVVYEGGSGLSNSFEISGGVPTPVPQSRDTIQAWGADLRLDYAFNDPHRSWLSGEFVYGSGDTDRFNTSNTLGGNRRHSPDTAFNAFGLINTGLAFNANVSNLAAFRVGAFTFPFNQSAALQQLQVGVNLFAFLKADANAPIDEPTRSASYLGFEPDLVINWQIRSDVTLALRYGAFLPNSDAFFSSAARQYFYGGVTFAF